MNFENQVVLITGASKGIGRRLAVDLAKKGATVVGCGRSRERLQETLDKIRGASPSSTMRVCDVSDRAQVRAMVSAAIGDFGKIDILINNAGIGMRQPFTEASLDTIEEIMRTNFLGMVYCTHAVLPSMISRGSGHVVNISSISGRIGALNMAAYCASKFAMNGFSESLYHELKPLGIHVSIVCPGPVGTGFNRAFADIKPNSPSGLVIRPKAVSGAVMRILASKKFETVMPHWLALICWFKRIAPNLFRAVAQRTFRRHVVGKEQHGI